MGLAKHRCGLCRNYGSAHIEGPNRYGWCDVREVAVHGLQSIESGGRCPYYELEKTVATKPTEHKFYIIVDADACAADTVQKYDTQKEAEAAARAEVEEERDTGARFVMGVVAAFVEIRAIVECRVEEKPEPTVEVAADG